MQFSVQRLITYTSFISVALASPWHRPVTDQSDCNGKTLVILKVDIARHIIQMLVQSMVKLEDQTQNPCPPGKS